MSQTITKEDLATFGKALSRDIKDGIREEIKVSTRDLISHFNASQGKQNDRLDKMDGRLDKMGKTLEIIGDDVAKVKLAVVDLLGTEKSLHNLVEELQRNGIAIDKQRVFAR